jgi:hypothetical protein
MLLGLDPEDMPHDIPSPFHSPNARRHLPALLPPSMRPTAIQLRVPHHPELDIFPFPEIRDRFILAQDSIDDLELCHDLIFGLNSSVEVDSARSCRNDVEDADAASMMTDRTGLIVWGDPWLPDSWEIGEAFARKYRSLMDDKAIECTNYWREMRGEEPLDLEGY